MSLPMARVDRIGRPQQDPHHLLTGIDGINWIAERVPARKVPAAAWSLDVAPQAPIDKAQERDPEPMAVVACPCKETIEVPVLDAPIGCKCERYYAFDTKDVWVFNSPYDATGVSPSPEEGSPAAEERWPSVSP